MVKIFLLGLALLSVFSLLVAISCCSQAGKFDRMLEEQFTDQSKEQEE